MQPTTASPSGPIAIEEFIQREPETHAKFLAIWEDAARATRNFLSQKNILAIRPLVEDDLVAIPTLCFFRNKDQTITVCIGTALDNPFPLLHMQYFPK